MTHRYNTLCTKEAARIIGVAPKTLKNWRNCGKGPCFIKLGSAAQAAVRYDRTEVEAWLSERAFSSTADASVNHPSGRSGSAAGSLNAPNFSSAKSCCGKEGKGTLLHPEIPGPREGGHD